MRRNKDGRQSHNPHTDKQLLLRQALELVRLGHIVEAKRKQMKKLDSKGVAYTDMQFFRALDEYNIAKSNWDELEKQHLKLRQKIEGKK